MKHRLSGLSYKEIDHRLIFCVILLLVWTALPLTSLLLWNEPFKELIENGEVVYVCDIRLGMVFLACILMIEIHIIYAGRLLYAKELKNSKYNKYLMKVKEEKSLPYLKMWGG